MPTIVVQSDMGDVAGANSYITLEEFKSYSDDHGFNIADYSDDDIEIALIKSLEFLDNRFSFNGYPRNDYETQVTEFPRVRLRGARGEIVDDIPREVKQAQNEYTFRVLSEPLFNDVDLTTANIQSVTNTVDVITTSTTYFRPTQQSQDNIYKKPDQIMLRSGFVGNADLLFLG